MEKAIGHIPEQVVESLKRGTNYFLGIGINKYQNYAHLNNAVKDVVDVSDVLVQNYYFEQNNLRFLLEEEATRENIIEELDGLRNILKNDDRILIYYSGHGYMDGELGFWVPVDAKRERKASLINNSEVQGIIKTIKARHILLISDSCFSGSLLVRDASQEANGVFLDFEKNPSRYVFSSGKGVVADGEKGFNSPFADAILKNLKSNDDAVNIVLLADQVAKQVKFNHEQKAECSPMYQSGHDGGQFVFFKRQTEKDRWEAALHQNSEAAYLKYLNEFSGGKFVKQAEQNLRDLADEKAWNFATMYDSAISYRDYLKKYPLGKYNTEAHAYIENVLEKENKNEREKSVKLEADKKIEAAKIEREKLERIEADKIQREILVNSEKEKLERVHLAKTLTDRIERERLDKIEADKKIEAVRIERERLDKIEADKKIEENIKEHERKAKIKFDKKIKADRIVHEGLAKIDTAPQPQENVLSKTIPAKKNYKIPIISSGVVLTFLFLIKAWLTWGPVHTTKIISAPVENTYTPPPTEGKLPLLSSVISNAETIDKFNESLIAATAAIDADYKIQAVGALNKASIYALNISNFPPLLIQFVHSAQVALENNNFQEAKRYIAKAKYGVIINKLTPLNRSNLRNYK